MREVEALLGRSVFVTGGEADVHISGSVVRAAEGGWAARLELRDATGSTLGHRNLELQAGTACPAAIDSIVLALSLMLDAERREARYVLPEPTRERRLGVAPAVEVQTGPLPGWSPWVGLTLDYAAAEHLIVGVRGAYGWRRGVVVDGEEARFAAYTASALACGSFRPGARLEARACGEVGGVFLEAEGLSFPSNQTAMRLVPRLGILVQAVWHLSPRLYATTGGELAWHASTPEFFFETASGSRQTLHEVQAFGAGARAGLGVRF
jgi:hypothetical protein